MSRSPTPSGEASVRKTDTSPFASQTSNAPRLQFPLAMMLLLIVVSMACVSMLLLAFRIPEVQGMVVDIFGGTRKSRSSDHESQLRFLMVCYSAPLMLTGITGIVYYMSTLLSRSTTQAIEADDDSPFS